MQIIRTISWVVITAILVAFIAINWTTVAVNFWPLNNGNYLHFEWPVGVIALIFFAFGMLPVWLYLRAVRWRLNRRIETLEKSLQATATPTPIVPSAAPAPTATQGATFDTYSPKDL
ncbi:hypothetical protein WSK_2890 [Novosphingobium sp. Rr 2-17]|uniref:LapA family protein n=1 Tax=Novosphingobium sp. Rr 2-17 TaxID=555793 RepID=UPI0002699EEE|nr:LapA family protein [Novosphingobium sp. Rr 2-17]EIZ78446.1 hypothetical protein WSK_2890 [Novosphingobium sp. Rr 2-17]